MASYKVTGILSVSLLTVVAAAIVKVPVPRSNDFAFAPKVTTIAFEGDGLKEDYNSLDGLVMTIKSDFIDTAIFAILHNAPVTTGMPADVASAWYVGSQNDAAASVGVECVVFALDNADSSQHKFRIVVFQTTINPDGKGIDDPKNKAKVGSMFSLTAKKVTKDLINVALPGVPADGAYYRLELLTPGS